MIKIYGSESLRQTTYTYSQSPEVGLNTRKADRGRNLSERKTYCKTANETSSYSCFNITLALGHRSVRRFNSI